MKKVVVIKDCGVELLAVPEHQHDITLYQSRGMTDSWRDPNRFCTEDSVPAPHFATHTLPIEQITFYRNLRQVPKEDMNRMLATVGLDKDWMSVTVKEPTGYTESRTTIAEILVLYAYDKESPVGFIIDNLTNVICSQTSSIERLENIESQLKRGTTKLESQVQEHRVTIENLGTELDTYENPSLKMVLVLAWTWLTLLFKARGDV